MQLLCRSDSNSRPNVRPVAGVPDHWVSKKHTNKGVSNVKTVTSRLHSGEGITSWARYKDEVKQVDLTPVTETPNRPGITDSTQCLMPSKQAEHCIPDRWPCHSVSASPPWTTCSPIGAVVDQQVQTYGLFDKVAGGALICID